MHSGLWQCCAVGDGLGLALGLAVLKGIVVSANNRLGVLHAITVSLFRTEVLGAAALGLVLAVVVSIAAVRGATTRAKQRAAADDLRKESLFFTHAMAAVVAAGVAVCGVMGQCLMLISDNAPLEEITKIRFWAQSVALLEVAFLTVLLTLGLRAAIEGYKRTRERASAATTEGTTPRPWSALWEGLVGGGLVCALFYQMVLPSYGNQLLFYIPWGASALCALICISASVWMRRCKQ